MHTHSFSKMLPPTPKLIKYLVIACLIFGCLAGFFQSALGLKAGVSFLHLFGLSFSSLIKGYIWQPFTFLFLPQLEGSLSFYYLFSLCFDVYLLWLIGNKVHRHFGPKVCLKLFFLMPIIGCVLAAAISFLFHFGSPIFGLTYAMIALIMGFCFSSADSHFNFLPMQSMQTRWLGLALIVLYLLQDLANLHFSALLGHFLVMCVTYFYLVFFRNLRSPFSITARLDDFILSRKRKPSSSKIIYLFNEDIQKESYLDKTFEKIKNNQKLSVLDKLKLRRYRRKNQSQD